MPVIVVAPNNELLDKLKSNIQVVRARGGRLFVIADDATGIAQENRNLLSPLRRSWPRR